jgi:catechol 2,3-dioxygenase-like lactoylglutathione lyase family enzyme
VSTASDSSVSAAAGTGSLHHVELWVPDLARARAYLASTDGFEVELVATRSALPHR